LPAVAAVSPAAVGAVAPFAAAAAVAADDGDHEHDQDPLPRPAYPITTAATADSELPLPLPEGSAAAGGGPLIISLSRQLSARVLQQAGVTPGPSATADDSLAVDAGPFGIPEAEAGLPAPAAVAVAAAAEQPGVSVVAVPGGGCVVVGSDVAPGSPPSSFTLSTRNSTEAGMSMTTAGLSTPPASGTTWEGQVGSFGLQNDDATFCIL
jgi:hypothetical protein